MEINQILIQKGNESYETRVIIQEGPAININRTMIGSQDMSVEELKILNDFIEMVDNFRNNKDSVQDI